MRTVDFLGLRFTDCTMDEAIAMISARPYDRFRYVVTPNVDHVVRLELSGDPEVRRAYRQADLCVCDSRILTFIARACGLSLATVTGSDLTAELLRSGIADGEAITLIGGDDETLRRLTGMFPRVVIRQLQPPMGLLDDTRAMDDAVAFIITNPARWIILAVGSPQQELIAYRAGMRGEASGTALCVGASIDFLIGRKRRAPVILRRLGLEWLHRLLSDPRHLWTRYLVRGPRIFPIAWRWRRDRRRQQDRR